MTQTRNLILINDLLSSEEIKSSLDGVDVTLVPMESGEKLRGALDPQVWTAIIGSTASMVTPILMLVITRIVERNKDKKKDGLLILKTENGEIHIPFVATEEEINKKLELMKAHNNVEHLMITSAKNE